MYLDNQIKPIIEKAIKDKEKYMVKIKLCYNGISSNYIDISLQELKSIYEILKIKVY